MKPALVLVDLQHGFLGRDGLRPAAGELVHRCARLLEASRTRGVPVAHVRTTVHRDPDDRMPHWRAANDWRFLATRSGHRTPDAVAPAPGETIVDKQHYSGFQDGDLERWLTSHGIHTLWLAGVHLHACIRQTALDASARGYEVVIAADAVGSDDPLHAAVTRRWLSSRCARFVEVRGLVEGTARSTEDEGGDRALDDVVERARDAQRRWRDRDLEDRAEDLVRLASEIRSRAEALIRQTAAEIAKPVRYGRREIDFAAALVDETIGRALRGTLHWTERDEEPTSPRSRARRRPHGVVAAVTPFNNPVAIPFAKITAAAIHGNAVIWKPSPLAPRTSAAVGDILERSAFPESLVQRIEGGEEVSTALLGHPGIDAASVTGSSAAGFAAQEIAARRRIPLQAELGGNNAALVWHDAEHDAAAARVAEGAFGVAGQRCTANRRLVVPRALLDRFLAALVGAVEDLPCGPPLDEETIAGPVVSRVAADRIEATVARAIEHGAEEIHRHRSTPDGDSFVPPTVLLATNPGSEIVQEETFGPVLVVQPVEDWEEGLRRIDGVRQGLVAAVFTRDESLVARFLDAATAGVLKVNRSTAGADPRLPFGGWKESGVGPPEHGPGDLEFYTRAQAVSRD